MKEDEFPKYFELIEGEWKEIHPYVWYTLFSGHIHKTFRTKEGRVGCEIYYPSPNYDLNPYNPNRPRLILGKPPTPHRP